MTLRRSDILRMAVRALTGRLLRSALTVSGVVIGIMAVVAMSAVIRGVDEAILGDVRAMNPNVVYLDRMGIILSRDEWLKKRDRPPVTRDDLRAITARCTTVAHADPIGDRGGVVTFGRQRTRDLTVKGVGPSYLEVNSMAVKSGRYFAPGETARGARVLVIAQVTAEGLFGQVDPVGKEVRLAGQEYTVVGTLASQASVGGFQMGEENFVAIPFEAYRRDMQTNPREGLTIGLLPREGVSVERMVDEVTDLMRVRRRLRASDENNFEMLTQESILKLWNQLSRTFFLGLIGISSIALLVSGIGVLAVMTVSVTERTREIGVRRAIGATRRAILLQFLLEAALLTAAGGALGSALGALAAFGIGALVNLPVSAPWGTFALAIGVSALTGLVFGVAPAYRAARLDPVEALRYE